MQTYVMKILKAISVNRILQENTYLFSIPMPIIDRHVLFNLNETHSL